MPIFSTDSGSINHLSITGSLSTSGSTVAFNSLTTQSQNWVLTYNSQSGQLFYTASTALGGGSSTPTLPGGSNTQIQFNSGSTFSGSTDLTFNYTNSGLQLGPSSTASGQHSFALGDLVQATGNGSQAEGQSSITLGNFSHAAGLHSVTSGAYQFVVGQYNATSSTSAAFIIGNGASTSSRSNLLFAADSQVQITGSLNVLGSITGSLQGTASWAQSASNAVAAQTASFLPVGTYNITASWAVSASQALTASRAISASVAQTASFLPVGTYNITSSWAQSASNAVAAQTASFLPVGTYNITSSWAQSASNAVAAQTASFLPTGTYNITSSWAVSASQASTASYANFALSASYASSSTSASYASSSTSASYALVAASVQGGSTSPQSLSQGTGITAFTFNGGIAQTVAVSGAANLTTNKISKWTGTAFANSSLDDNGTLVTGSVSIQLTGTDSRLTGSFTGSFTGPLTGTSSWAQSASNAVSAQTASFLPTGTYNITSSWAVSASQASTASFLPVGTYNITASWAQSASNAVSSQTASFLPTGTYNITSSWAQSASNAVAAQTASFLPVGTYNITSSWAVSASQAVSASRATTASFALSAPGTTPQGLPGQIQYNSASVFQGVPTLTYDGTTLRATGSFTGSLVGSLTGTSSWAQSASNAVSSQTASFLPVGTYAITSSWAVSASQAQTASALTAGTYSITSSWAQSASNAVSAQTASFLPVGTYAITSSWAISASRATTASFLTAGTYSITSSWAQSASNAVSSQTASFLPVGTYNITSSWAQSASNAISAQTASFLPTGTYNITSSWAQSASNAVNAQTASFLPVGTYNITSSWAVSASRATTASFALSAPATTPQGSPGQIQYNSASVFQGVPVLTYDGTTLRATGSFTGSLVGSLTGTSSWAQSASNAVNAQTASFLPIGTYNITSSWAVSASQALTASFLPVATYNITSSWAVSASQAVSASRALTASFLPAGTYNITSSWATNALTASNLTAGTYNVTASLSTGVQGGIANYIPLWNTATTLTSSTIYQDGSGNIGIRTTSPVDALYIESGSISLRANPGNTPWTSMIKTYPASTGGVGMGATMWSANTSVIADVYGHPGFIGRNLFYSGSQFYAATTNGGVNWGVVTGMMVTNIDTRFLGRAASENGTNFGLGTNIDPITRMVITTAGDVGIGTVSPSFRLDVSGSNSARFQNGLTVNGALQASNITGSLFGTASWAQSASLAINVIAGGSNEQIQFNSGSRLSGSSAFVFHYTTQSLEQGLGVSANGLYTHAQGWATIASGSYSHAEGYAGLAFGNSSHAEGSSTKALTLYSHAEGNTTTAGLLGYAISGSAGIVNGQLFLNTAYGNVTSSFTAGGFVVVNDYVNSIARYTITSSLNALTFSGGKTGILLSGSINVSNASGNLRITVPTSTTLNRADQPIDYMQHSEGASTIAIGGGSHAEGSSTQAIGFYSHAEGIQTVAIGQGSNTKGLGTVANGQYQLAMGQYNQLLTDQGTFIIGNGSSDSVRSNLLVAGGSQVEISGSLRVTGSAFITGLTNTAQTNVLTYNSSTGQVFFTASSAIGGGGTPTSIATGSVTASVTPTQFSVTSGSVTEFTVTGTGVTIGNTSTDTHRITGSLSITGSFALTGSSASILSGSASGSFITNLGDTYSVSPVTKIVTLSQTEYDNIITKDSNTLYIIVNLT